MLLCLLNNPLIVRVGFVLCQNASPDHCKLLQILMRNTLISSPLQSIRHYKKWFCGFFFEDASHEMNSKLFHFGPKDQCAYLAHHGVQSIGMVVFIWGFPP